MRRQKTTIFFIVFGISLIVLAVVLNVGWILLNLREVALLILGAVFFALIITGLILNTIFLVKEVKRNEQHDAFLNSVTHELKTPIASIKLYLETLKTRDVDVNKRAEFYDVMLADSDRLLTTVEQVLKASSTREKKRRISTDLVNIENLLEECISVTLTQRKLDRSVIRFTRPAFPATVIGEAADLKTAFLNILDNAVKYSGDSPIISVRIKKRSSGNRLEIYIKDNGTGIPRTELKRIFKRFYRVSGVSARGTGLGLFIVRSIIERYGGKVFAKSRGEGKGSTFIVTLPAAE